MIQNNLDPAVALFPHELITYGGNGAVLQNWYVFVCYLLLLPSNYIIRAQYHLLMEYLAQMTEEQTLVMYSGHPLGYIGIKLQFLLQLNFSLWSLSLIM
jgi:urocanate hydratase